MTDRTNETTPNPQRRAARERGRGLTESAWRADSKRWPTARVALGVRPRTRSWCVSHPPTRGLGAREWRARSDVWDKRNDANPPTKSGAGTRPRTHRERVSCGLPAPADRARRARRASARPLVVRALPVGAKVSERESDARGASDGTNAHGERATRRRGWSEGAVLADRQTRREEEEEKTNTARERPCSTAAARATRGVNARRACPARVVCRSVRHSLAPLEVATTENTRNKDDDRRQRTGEDYHSGANTPARLRRREPPAMNARATRAPFPPARGLGARELRAGGNRRDKRNDANPPTKSGGANAAADSPRARCTRTPSAGRPRASQSECARSPARGARPTRRRGASE